MNKSAVAIYNLSDSQIQSMEPSVCVIIPRPYNCDSSWLYYPSRYYSCVSSLR